MIKVSAHFEQLKFGKTSDAAFGIDLSYSQSRAVFAVQKLLDGTNYTGNSEPCKLEGFDGDVPVLCVRTRDYLNAYGVQRHVTKRGKLEFSGEGRRVAMAALRSLANNDFHVVYVRKVKRQKTNIDIITPLIGLEEAGSRLTITPAPVLVDQIQDYYILKPEDLYEQAGGSDVLFLEYLLYHTSRKTVRKKNLVFTERTDTIAGKLRLHHLIRERKRGEIRKRLNSYYQVAKQLGYLDRYEVDQPGVKFNKVDVLSLPVAPAMSTSSKSKVYQLQEQRPQND